MQKKILGILSFSLIITANSWATRIPVFSGYWYYTADNMNLNAHTNACAENQGYNYEFTHKTTSKYETAISYAHSYFCNYYSGQCPTSCKIYWEGPNIPQFIPHTFPNKMLWELTIVEPYNPQSQQIGVHCEIPFYGNQSVYPTVEPLYNDCTDHGCLDVCAADIPGRHLDDPLPELVKPLGHLGIATAPITGDPEKPYTYNVLEVLNEEEMIQINTLDDFRSRDWYWGTRFTAPDMPFAPDGKKYPNLEQLQSAAVFRAGADQMQFCQEYSLIPMLCHPGSNKIAYVYDSTKQMWVTQLTETCAKFRSDIFVNYAFEKAIGVKLPTPSRYGHLVMSVFTYDSMLNARPAIWSDNLSAGFQQKAMLDSEPMIKLSSQNELSEAIDFYKKKKNDEEVFEKLVYAVTHLNEDESISSAARTRILLDTIEKNKDDIELVKLLSDNFSSSQYNLSYSLDESIELFNYYQDPTIKSHLLRGLATTYNTHLAGKTDKKTIEQAKVIQSLFIEQTKKPQKGVYTTAQSYLTSILPAEEAEKIMQNISMNNLSQAEKNSIEKNKILIAFNLLKQSEKEWQDYMNSFSKEQNVIFAQKISALVSIPSYLETFNQANKQVLKKYLLAHWPTHFKKEEGDWSYDMQNWFIALANLSTDNPDERSEIRLCYLLQHPQVLEIALYTLSFTFEYDENQLTTCYQDLQTKLNMAMSDPATTSDQRYFINISIQMLEERKALLLKKLDSGEKLA
jgi:hypothetical protein